MLTVEEKTYKRKLGIVGSGSFNIVIPLQIILSEKYEKGDDFLIQIRDGKIVMEKKENGTKER